MRPRSNPDATRLEASDLDEIRAGVDWQGLFTGLGLRKAERKSKPNDWWAFSPFHDEKTPSFHMGPGGLWYDFSVGEGGGPIELVQRIHGLNCFEAGRLIVDSGWSSVRFEAAPPRQQQQRTRRRTAKAIAGLARSTAQTSQSTSRSGRI